MAAAGLPKTGRIGFELFDKINLGATEFTEHVNYRRALEGELERSVMSLTEVEQARVHLTFPKDSVFLDAQQPAKASVLVKTRPGARLSPQNVVAIDHLVASAVEGLSPDAVSVLDMNGNLLGRPARRRHAGRPGAVRGRSRLPPQDRERSAGQDQLDARAAARRRTSFAPACRWSAISPAASRAKRSSIRRKSVMVSSQRTEDVTGGATASGVPGHGIDAAAAHLAAGGRFARRVSRVTENITYQTSRTVKKTRHAGGRGPQDVAGGAGGSGGTWETDKNGFKRVLVPPAAGKAEGHSRLVAGITGFNAERGDQLVIETLPFETTLLLEPPRRRRPPLPADARPPTRRLPGLKLDQRDADDRGRRGGGLRACSSCR